MRHGRIPGLPHDWKRKGGLKDCRLLVPCEAQVWRSSKGAAGSPVKMKWNKTGANLFLSYRFAPVLYRYALSAVYLNYANRTCLWHTKWIRIWRFWCETLWLYICLGSIFLIKTFQHSRKFKESVFAFYIIFWNKNDIVFDLAAIQMMKCYFFVNSLEKLKKIR